MNRLFQIRGLSNGLPTTDGALIPKQLIDDLTLEANHILYSPAENIQLLGEEEQRELLKVFAIVSKHFCIPCIEIAKSQLALTLQKTDEDADTFEHILAIDDPFTITQIKIPFASLKIEKSEACKLMATEGVAPAILFEANSYPKNRHGFPCSNFSHRLKLTQRIIIDAGIQRSLITAACAAVAAYNRVLPNDRVALNTSPIICPLDQFKRSVLETGKTLTQLVDYQLPHRLQDGSPEECKRAT